MKIKQFEDKGLAHYSYAILSECEKEIILVDPSRNISEYMKYADEEEARITGVIETHPHADFVSGHLELHEKLSATLYCSHLVGADYPHQTFDHGNSIAFGKIKLKALNTPGHSPDSICVVLEHDGKDKAVFTGDTLFIGDCGRPDLRENAGNVTAKRNELAAQMYHSLRDQLMPLENDVIIYPAHGAGTLCGKALSDASQSTIGDEKKSNWSLQEMSEQDFIKKLTEDQPFVPKYFPYDVDVNKQGAIAFDEAISSVSMADAINSPETAKKINADLPVIDSRPSSSYRDNHLPGSINLMNGGKFETWLGSLIAPEEQFYLAAENSQELASVIARTAKIGYEPFIAGAFVLDYGSVENEEFNLAYFKEHIKEFIIVDVRNETENKEHPIFEKSINIPLPELRERAGEIPSDKPIAVHCASGYRSAAGTSIIADKFDGEAAVYDISDAIKEFDKHAPVRN